MMLAAYAFFDNSVIWLILGSIVGTFYLLAALAALFACGAWLATEMLTAGIC